MPKEMRPNGVQKQQTINVRGQMREYYYVTTVKSMEELEAFRFKNHCMFNGSHSIKRLRDVAKSFIMPCTRKKFGKRCDFELRAVRPDLDSGTIHVYAHAKHNHPLMPEGKRARIRREKELMPAENPPKTLRTPDNINWQFVQTFADYDEMQKFRCKSGCNSKVPDDVFKRRLRIRFSCTCRQSSSNCQFMIIAIKTTANGYHVYKHGVHKHKNMHIVAIRKKQRQRNINQQVIMADDDEERMEESEEGIEEVEKRKEHAEDGKGDDNNEQNGEEQAQQDDELRPHVAPPKKITKKIKGQPREYRFLKTVKSLTELDTLRFENHCYFLRGKPHQLVNPLILYCARTQFGVTCAFQLLAIPSSDLESGAIHVYAHSQHSDHPFLSAERRARIKKGKELMPAENPPKTFVTPDNIKWQFLQTFPDYEKMHKFRLKNQCQSRSVNRIRAYCKNRWSHNCPFMFLALKTTKEGYHLYKHGQHKHNKKHHAHKPKERQQPVRACQHKRARNMEMETEEEKEEDGEGEEKNNREVPIKEVRMLDELIEHEDEGGDEDEDEEEDEDEGEDEEEEINNEERGHDEIEEQGQHEDEASEEVPEEAQEDGIPMIEDEQQQQQNEEEVQKEGSIKIEIIESPREPTLEEQLAKANEKVYKWMAGIPPNDIGRTLGEWDNVSLLKMIEMADQEIRENPQKLNLWLPWLKCAIPKCSPQIEGFNVRFKALIKLAFD